MLVLKIFFLITYIIHSQVQYQINVFLQQLWKNNVLVDYVE